MAFSCIVKFGMMYVLGFDETKARIVGLTEGEPVEDYEGLLKADMRARLPALPEWLMANSRLVRVSHGERFMRSQEAITHVYIVHSGQAAILSGDGDGRESMVASVSVGGVIGEMEVIAGLRMAVYSARASEDSELVKVPADLFLEWMHRDQEACWQLARMLAEKMHSASRRTSTNAHASALQRLVAQLLLCGPGRVRFSRQELAEACSVSLRTINRCVMRLRQEGAIGIERGKITLTPRQLAALEQKIGN